MPPTSSAPPELDALPRAWFPERPAAIPGRVYALYGSVPTPPGTEDAVGARRLMYPARVARLPA